MRKRLLFILPTVWAVLPWLFWLISLAHKADHADTFWLPMMPLVLVSLLPSLVLPNTSGAFIPLSHAAVSSVFNFAVGLLLSFFFQKAVLKK